MSRRTPSAGGNGVAPDTPLAKRSCTVDSAKAIGIVLVVIGHAPAIAPLLSDIIFAFHMPFFFFLSGLLVSPERLAMPFLARARSLSRSLLAPYLFYFVVAWLYWLVAKRHGLRALDFAAVAWWQPWQGLLLGTGDALYVDPALWFLPCLFLTALIHHAARSLLDARTAALSLLAIAFIVTVARPSDWPPWPWSADCALVAAGFYACGAWSHRCLREDGQVLSASVRAVVAAIALAICIAAVPLTGHVDLSHLSFGRVPATYLPLAACGTVGAVALASLLPPSRIARWLSDNTLVIFPLHMLFFSIVTGTALRLLGFDFSFKNGSGWIAVVYVATALGACVPAARVLRRLVPWLFRSTPGSRNALAVPA